jgi:hypothetical protein
MAHVAVDFGRSWFFDAPDSGSGPAVGNERRPR